jgi:hypothetical protein
MPRLRTHYRQAEDFIKVAMIRLMVARLAGQQTRYHGIRATAA